MADTRDHILAVSGSITEAIRNQAVSRAALFIYGAVQGYSGEPDNPFASGAFSEQLDGTGHDGLYLSHWPITAVSAITDEDDASLGLTLNTDYFLLDSIANGEYHGILVKKSGRWTPGTMNHKVSYTAGFNLATYCSQALTDAVEMIALAIVEGGEYAGVKQVKVEQVSYTYESRNGVTIPIAAANLLRAFCRYRWHK